MPPKAAPSSRFERLMFQATASGGGLSLDMFICSRLHWKLSLLLRTVISAQLARDFVVCERNTRRGVCQPRLDLKVCVKVLVSNRRRPISPWIAAISNRSPEPPKNMTHTLEFKT
jgi:hypothetical protein